MDVSVFGFLLFSPVETNKLLFVGVSPQLAAGGHGVRTGSVLIEGNRNNTKTQLSVFVASTNVNSKL